MSLKVCPPRLWRSAIAVIAGICALTGSAAAQSSVTASVQVYSGAGANGPDNLVSNAIPFRPGQITSARDVRVLDGSTEVPVHARVLATWPSDGSIRTLLLQFDAPSAKNYTMQIGATRTTSDRGLVPVTWDVPTRIFTLPASYLSDSLIFWEQKPLGQTGFPSWDQKQISGYGSISSVGTATCASSDQYYDTITTSYQMYARTGDVRYLVNGRRWALHHRRDQINLSGGSVGRSKCADNSKTRYTFPQGLVQDYFMFGDEEAKNVSALIVDNFYMPHGSGNYYQGPGGRGFWTEREPAFALIGILAHYEATGNATYLNRVRERVTSLHRMQVDHGRRAWVHNLYDHDPSEGCGQGDYGSSPWMSGLLLEAVIKFHKLTNEAIARESILMAVDDLSENYLATGDYAGESFVYLGCSQYSDGQPDLDNLISHAYGYAYKLTGNQSYRTLGTALFNTATSEGATSTHKHFDQQFRSSGHFPAYISGSTTPPPPPPPNAPRPPTTVRILR